MGFKLSDSLIPRSPHLPSQTVKTFADETLTFSPTGKQVVTDGCRQLPPPSIAASDPCCLGPAANLFCNRGAKFVMTSVGFVPVTARWRSDSHTITALCHSESGGRRERRSEE
ncbi:hypothetical protein AVEN_45619-1 [Araneus ventricosus]|uniref:Uncharacterized protein n=1 Tax=Araneus ventricosus TaxID=182803 RepID=A0A4Y2ES74_ARAVE|nr:hypothetical protein AVEN_45619-1 [Araneus ventricosus]